MPLFTSGDLGLDTLVLVLRIWSCLHLGMCGKDFFNFGSVSVVEKNSDSVRNEFGSVQFAKTRFGSLFTTDVD